VNSKVQIPALSSLILRSRLIHYTASLTTVVSQLPGLPDMAATMMAAAGPSFSTMEDDTMDIDVDLGDTIIDTVSLAWRPLVCHI